MAFFTIGESIGLSALPKFSIKSVIFAVNLVLTLMIVFAPPGLKNITAQ